MRARRYIRTIIALLILLLYGGNEIWAAADVTVVIDDGITDGTVTSSVATRVVTLTVTPAADYYLKASDIVVEPLVDTENPKLSGRRRVPGTAEPIVGTLYNHATEREASNIINSILGTNSAYYVFTVPEDYDGVYVTATFTETLAGEIRIPSSSSITYTANGHYILEDDVNASVLETLFTGSQGTGNEFTGTFEGVAKADGTFPKITGLTTPLFSTINGGTVKNIMLESVNITSGTNVGAIANEATGESRIYNCGILNGSVGGSGNVGGLVGTLDGKARVINCFSFATITGGSNVGGIVGNNKGTTTATSINTMVMNCMFYGDITGGSTVSPVYGGNNIANLQGGLNTFNYYAYDKLKTKAVSNNKYNSALAVEERYLNRFEFYRLLLNSNKKLAAFYITGDASDADLLAKWVLETADRTITDPYPYPILKAQGRYPSIINYDAENAPTISLVDGKPSETDRNNGGKIGTLSVTISGVGNNAPSGATIVKGHLSLIRTDKDPDRFNFNYDKVQLPYYNDVGTGNYTGNRVVTGWKITAITAVPNDPYTSANYPTTGVRDYPDHNYADRKSSNKDLYSVSGRVFSQGAYFDVPYGVSSITIEPYWGKACYIADPNYDVVYKADYTGKQDVAGTGTQVNVGTTLFNGQSVQKSIEPALNYIRDNLGGEGSTVYDNALVLVGNYHLDGVPLNGSRPFTMMSVDTDNDHEPDYCLIYHHKNRSNITPIRFDFLAVPGTAQAQKPNGASLVCNFTIFKTRGWFEVTNTAFMYSNQLEYENGDLSNGVTKMDAPLILLGGIFDQFVSTQTSTVNGHTIYIHLGGNLWIDQFGMGTHSDGSKSTPHVPVSVTGGEFNGFYLTGTYNPNAEVRDDNAECYISGGHFNEVAGACQEQLGATADNRNGGDVHWQIYNADIDNFFGGGINDAKPVKGNITTDIYNSYVTTFCGGPKFGNMSTGKTVTTTAEGCVFGKYFGAGYGGNSFSRKKYYDQSGNPNWNTLEGYYTADRGKYYNGVKTGSSQTSGKDYGKKGPGVATDFDYEFFVWSSGTAGVRFFVKFASFSLAQCGNVFSNLKGCTVKENFYGGGSLGEVTGTATSVLDGCTVLGNVFGGGYSGTLPKIPVRTGGFTTKPNFNSASGMFEPGVYSGTTDYDWKQVESFPSEGYAGFDGEQVITTVDLTTLGQVGHTDLTIKGETHVVGNVFGGGDESAVRYNTKVDIQNSALSGLGYVYGGGNTADVDGNAVVTMTGGKVINNVFGGGKGQTTVVGGDVTVNIGSKSDAEPPVYSGTGTVDGNVYGGSALGNVNATKGDGWTVDDLKISGVSGKTTNVNLYGGTVTGSVFGGGLGQIAVAGSPAVGTEGEEGYKPAVEAKAAIASNVYGPVTVTVEGSATGENVTAFTAGNVFGCNDQNGAPQSTVNVYVKGTATPTNEVPNPIGNVYGGGNLAAYSAPVETPNYPVVTMTGGTVYDVYGGGLGESAVVTGNPSVSISDGTVNQDVYGGGSEANVTGSVAVSITGGTVTHDVYGGGALADTNTDNWDSSANEGAGGWAEGKTSATNVTTVSLTGGTIGNAYGGGLGRKGEAPKPDVAAKVYGNVLVELNRGVANNVKGCVVNQVFGGNNLNGYPVGSTTVHVYGTQHKDKATISEKYTDLASLPTKGESETLKEYLGRLIDAAKPGGTLLTGVSADVVASAETTYGKDSPTNEELNTSIGAVKAELASLYDVQAVYGGGNEADYVPADTKQSTEVIIENCNNTVIKDVYGGGNAAAVPATEVWILGAKIIDNLFGGGNGERGDAYAAHVGYHRISASEKSDYTSGTGETHVKLVGGNINVVYGGSNSHGDIRGGSNILMPTLTEYNNTHDPDATTCELITQHIYGGGKNADMSSGTNIVLGCMPDGWIGEIYAGAQAADVAGNVSLTITSGKFERVFGGNKDSGKLEGSITVNIEETGGCDVPIVIGELYGGGNLADYSIYGYDGSGHPRTEDEYNTWYAALSEEDKAKPENQPYNNPQVNVRAFTSIGTIYGGGYRALMVGNPSIDINVAKGSHAASALTADNTPTLGLPYPAHESNKIGAISNVFGGGNLANVIGNTAINIGTESTVDFVTPPTHLGESGVAYTYNATTQLYEGVSVSGVNITGSVYGGGNAADIIGNTTITIGTVDLTAEDDTKIAGNVFGGGLGATTTVTGNVEVNIGKRIAATESTPESYVGYATISRDIYGGSAKGKVNATKSGTAPVTYSESSGTTQVNLYGGTIVGNLYGGGYGLDNAEADVYGAVAVNVYGGTVPNVFGGNNLSGVTRNTVDVNIAGGTVSQNVYGGGNAADALDDVTVTVTGGTVTLDVYGGGKGQNTVVGGDVTVNIGAKDGEGNLSGSGVVSGNVYGGSALGAVNAKKDGGVVYSGTALDPKVTAVNIYGGTVTGSVFGGGLGEDDDDPVNDIVALSFGDVAVTMEGGTVTSAVYGGSNINGVLKGSSTVTIAGGTIHSAPGEGDPVANVVFGGGFGEPTRVEGDVTVNIGSKSDTEPPVYSGTATVHGSVYGGSAKGTVNAYDNSGTLTLSSYPDPEDPENSTLYRETHVNLYGGTVNGALYGGGYGKDDATSATYSADVYGAVTVTTKGSGTAQDVFGCNNVSGTPRSTVAVAIDGGTIGNVYGGGKDAPYTSTPTVTMSNGTVTNVYGGGLGATAVTGGSSVTISGGTVNNDVYGGGSLADVTGNVSVSVTGGTIVNDVYGGGALANTNTANWDDTNNTWAEGKDSNSNTTAVILTGGTVGNVYGGALGQHAMGTEGDPGYTPAIEPKVYGDITLTINKEDGTGTAKFLRDFDVHEYEGTYLDSENVLHTQTTTGIVYTKGCVFGANNKEGTPKGNIQVTVWSTTPTDYSGSGPMNHKYLSYEIQNVYGGGNLSEYVPADGKTTHVDIHGCDRTSIQFVFGGGNAAAVPETNVTIWGDFEIETVFGGGNGSEPYWSRTEEKWVECPGAAVGTSNVTLKGGYLHSAFGGSYERGTVGTINLDKSGTGGECKLRVTDVFGGGKDADVDHDINITISDCAGYGGLVSDNPDITEIKNVYAGSYNARIFGSITMTVTSGIFTNVFGGNHTSGFINGPITINIEETEKCEPVIIDNLYGGGNYAPYPGLGANNPNPQITVNVKSATRIGNIYGGGNHAIVNGDIEVNIDMIKGWWAGRTYTDDDGSITIPNAIGTIGNVYGGGNEGDVNGDVVVNIATKKEIELESTPQTDPETSAVPAHLVPKSNGKYDVLGVNITGDVYGGCYQSNVTGNTTVNICTADYSDIDGFEGVSIGGSIYGGGCQGDVLKNTYVTMAGGYVYDGVYGGGLHGSVGSASDEEGAVIYHTGTEAHSGCIGKIEKYKTNTGKCTVAISGGQVGPREAALAAGGMKNTGNLEGYDGGPVDVGFVFGAGRGEVENPAEDVDADFHTYVKETDVTISGGLIMASVYGGGENGRVRGNTHVTISGGQIGCGVGSVDGSGNPLAYDDEDFFDPIGKTEEYINEHALAACSHWDFEDPYAVFDPYATESGNYYEGSASSTHPTDGKTYYGCVFGGGSGYWPYVIEEDGGTVKKYEWLRSAGWVEGNTVVDITGGHILTNIYGGNEYTDVGTEGVAGTGKCTVNFGGTATLGVPRTLAQIKAHPVICYLFGSGKGDSRIHFNTWTNVNEVEVNVTGGIIYGSVFGGGEDAHVLGNTEVNISGTAKIGTWGTSYVDGNVFGGGRGFDGKALTAGSVGGNVDVNITGGTMLGSVYGGGRLASVGIPFVSPTLGDGVTPNPNYGLLRDETGADGDPTYGHVTVDISGGIIGGGIAGSDPTTSDIRHSGNVFGGSMGRNTLLSGSLNPLWPKLAVVKLTDVTIRGTADIKRSVYGGGELGIVRNQATVNVSGGTVRGSVFGGGYGSIDDSEASKATITAGGYDEIPTIYYTFTPMIWNGCVSGNTFVNVTGGKIYNNVYGGGEYASVGLINFNSNEGGTVYNYITKHDEPTEGFALSWPYEFQYIEAAPKDASSISGGAVGGKATINISGGRIGIKDGDDTNGEGDVYGGSKGVAGDSYKYAFCANVKETEINIIYPTTPDAGTGDGLYTVEYDTEEKEWQDGLADKDDDDTDLILGSVYGGGENGHVMDDTNVNMEGGLIGHALYGGGKGKDKYSQTLKKSITPAETYTANSYSITAGKVYGNTNITMTGGHVIRNIYGGGNMASVGKGNYAIGDDDFLTVSYGETAGGNLWTSSSTGDNAWHFLHSGKATVSVTGGTVGFENSQKDDLPTGNIYGGCRGRAAAEVTGIDVNPEFYVGYVNETDVSIGDGSGSPTILGSVYGGGQDGHVRRETHVTVNNGEIGVAYDGASGDNVKALKKAYDHDTNKTLTSDELAEFAEPTHFLWMHRGNVYGGGSGIAKYKFDYNGDGDTDDNDGSLEYYDNPVKEKDFSSSAGSVTHSTTVEIKGGTVHRNVYGGGSLASVIPAGTGEGPYRDESHGKGKKSLNMVSISGGTIGDASSHDVSGNHVYGGEVYGASRGESHDGMNYNYFALASGTEVNILADNTPVVYGSVYGGGELGRVQKDTQVNLLGGTVKYDAYGGGKGTVAVAANVGGDATVELNGTTASNGNITPVPQDTRGCVVNRIFGCNNINGSPQGHVKVHIHRTQNALKSKIEDKFPLYHKYTPTDYADVLDDFVTIAGSDQLNITGFPSKATLTTAFAGYNDKQKQDAVDSYKAQLSAKYDVQYVYGGGNLAMYLPSEADLATEFAEVIIDGCELTSINTVYGGGNAASTPANSVTVWGTYEIDELFGGGNGKDDYLLDGEWYQNPGADVGYRNMTYYVRKGETGHSDGTHGTGTSTPTYDPYKAIVKTPPSYSYDASTKEGRQAADYPTGYKYGAGSANTMVYGGYVHIVYGGSNEKGNIRSAAVSTYEEKSDCPLKVDYSYGAGKNAIIDGDVSMVMDCVENIDNIYGGSTNADVLSDINLKITNGSFKKVFGGNNTDGAIYGSITVDIEERGCQPIYIEELYSGGYLAPYSVYGYKKTGGVYDRDANGKLIPLKSVGGDPLVTQAHHDPCVNVISATRIDNIYGGGYKAAVIGSPHVNVNMTNGKIISSYVASKGIEVGENTDAKGNKFMVERIDGDAILAIGTIGTIFGGGNEADIIGNTYVDIGTGEWLNAERQREMLGTTDDILTPTTFTYNATSEKWEYADTDDLDGEGNPTIKGIDDKPTPSRNAAFITGSVYGGGKMGHVGDFTFDEDGTNDIPDGKPISCTEGTGTCYVTVSNGSIGPDNMQMFHLVAGDYPADDKPDDSGHVFGGCQGTLDYYYDDTTGKTEAEKLTGMLALGATTEARNAAMNAKVGKLAFCDATNVTINDMAWVKGSVFGGPENGHVLHDTHVNIAGDCQIGNGHILLTNESGHITVNRGVNRRYTPEEWAAGKLLGDGDWTFNSLPECASWLYGKHVSGGNEVTDTHHAPYDKFADAAGYDEDGGLKIATSGRSFYGSVFAGGSGYFPYAPGHWLETAGEVEGNATVTVTGGHILTSLYGGNEMSSVLGDTYVTMSGGTVGVPRTLDEIDAHPVTCYVFGGGKGESRPMLNNDTNVKNTNVTISGGWVYGSVFGGAEDGHVIEDANVTIEGNPVDPSMTPAEAYAAAFAGTVTKIGTWGTSYVDGNIFGGGRGFDGHNVFAGCVEGNVNISISGGEMLGSVYGGGRLGSVGINNSGEEMDDVEDDESTPSIDETKRHGHITINISGGTIGNNDEYPYVYKKVKAADDTEEGNWETVRANIPHTEFYEGYSDFKEKIADEAIVGAPDGSSTVITEEAYGDDKTYKSCGLKKVFQCKGGNVFAGGMGRLTKLNGDINPNWDKLGQAKTTELIISQASDAVPTIIKGSIFGGAEFGQVKGNASINITGGSIGTEIQHNGVTQYTYGTVFGGGYGSLYELTAEDKAAGATVEPRDYAGLVTGNTTVSMSAGVVKSSVYGGGKLAQTDGNTNVTISGGRIGLNKVRKGDGYVMYGGPTMGNVYGSGRGDVGYTKAGLVKGNTNVTISPSSTVDGEPFIAHNVYGGGSLASVGTFTVSDGTSYTPLGVPVANSWVDGTGVATVSITGGTIGISGRDNGMVNGSSRGDVDVPVASKLFGLDVEKDPYDKMAWVKQSIVNIGSSGPGAGAGPHIKGSVYGGGENGHNEDDATVNIYSGIIGIVDKDDPWYDFDDADINDKAKITRGNVYGAGCGTDTYTSSDDGKEYHNSWAGCVIGNTYVNIYGGHVTHNVYGGGSLGSVGALYYDPDQKDGSGNYLYKHEDKTKGFALSWPYHIHYENGGTANVTITGGRIGTTGSDNGDVFGGTRGEAGDRYTMANIGNVQNTVVNISYSSTPGDDKIEAKEKIDEDDGLPKYSLKLKDTEKDGVTGSVYGGCEDGHVYGNTQVNITKGFIGHAVYGGGKGKGKYKNGEGKKVYSITAGKVYGNTNVTMEGGHVLRNVYGGGNLGSIGKGNYAGGSDDIYPSGYGESLNGNSGDDAKLWDKTANDNAQAFMESGIATVNVTGGIVGFMPQGALDVIPMEDGSATTFDAASAELKAKVIETCSKDGLPTGNIFGGARGQAAAEIESLDDLDPNVNPNFFLGYVNETDVTVGDGSGGPRIYGSVYGGGQDGHVRRGTDVTINKGEIGVPYDADEETPVYTAMFGTDLNNLHWLHRGNVYGGGSGIGTYKEDEVQKDSPSAGSVTHTTNVTVANSIKGRAGTQDAPGNVIYRNVYGGGSRASVCPPAGVGEAWLDDTHGIGKKVVNTVNISGAVGVLSGYVERYGGEVYGASRGDIKEGMDPAFFAVSVWTKVNINNGATIMGNVFGGGDSGKVLKDTEVNIGEEATP